MTESAQILTLMKGCLIPTPCGSLSVPAGRRWDRCVMEFMNALDKLAANWRKRNPAEANTAAGGKRMSRTTVKVVAFEPPTGTATLAFPLSFELPKFPVRAEVTT